MTNNGYPLSGFRGIVELNRGLKALSWVRIVFLVAVLLNIAACQQQNQSQPPTIEQSPPVTSEATSESESRLVFNNVTLEQSNDKGQALWKIKAERAVYSQDKKTAQLDRLTGNLFQDGAIVLKISAEKGKIENNGQKILLQENIIATDQRNGTVFRGSEAEWLTQENLLIVRQNLTASHPKLNVSASEGRYFSREERLELQGSIVATAKDPALIMKTEHLFWQIPQQKLIADRRVEIDRYQGKIITDRTEADRGSVALNSKIAQLQQNVELKSLAPPMQIATNSAIWDIKARTVTSSKPMQLVHREDKITMTANQGNIDLTKKVARLEGGVSG